MAQSTSRDKILVVLTNVEAFPETNRATGVWLAEAVHFVDKMSAAGFRFDYVSPIGGYAPLDPDSLKTDDSRDWKWYRNKEFRDAMGQTRSPEMVDPKEYFAIYYAGGYGVVFDFPQSTQLQEITREIYESGGFATSV